MPINSERFDVVIAGSSFAGLTLATALSQTLGPQCRVALIDRKPLRPALNPAAQADPRAFAISAGSKRMLEVLGLWSELADKAQPVADIEITDSALEAAVRPVFLHYDNTVGTDSVGTDSIKTDSIKTDSIKTDSIKTASVGTASVGTASVGTDSVGTDNIESDKSGAGEPASYIVESAHLREALLAAVLTDAAISVIDGAGVDTFAADEDAVTVTLSDGKQMSGALLVAADGRGSRLREMAGIGTVNFGHPQIAIVTTIKHEKPHDGRAIQHFLPGGPFAFLPLKGRRACITWTEEAATGSQIIALDDAGFLAELQNRFGFKLGTLALDGPRLSWPLETHLARRIIGRRFALAGDSAHGVHPIAGQGLNLAFRDVAALAEVLAESARLGIDLGSGEALERYQSWRRFDSALSAAVFGGLNQLFSNDWGLLRMARDAGLGLVERMPGLKRLIVAEAAGLTGETPRLLKGEKI